MLLWSSYYRSDRQTGGYGLLPLRVVPVVVWRPGERFHTLEARGGADYGWRRARRYLQQIAATDERSSRET